MSTYSVADAKAGLPGLINRALAGEEVIITRRGKPVVEPRPASAPKPVDAAAALARLVAHRVTLPPGAPISVELLNLIHDDPDGMLTLPEPGQGRPPQGAVAFTTGRRIGPRKRSNGSDG